jgi:hypothetical protein
LTLADTLIGVRQLNHLSEDELVTLVEPAISQYLAPRPSEYGSADDGGGV